jgi:hypothetical protein
VSGCNVTPHNKGMKLTKPVEIGASQLIPRVGQTIRRIATSAILDP